MGWSWFIMKRLWGFSIRFTKLRNTLIAAGASLSWIPSVGWAGNLLDIAGRHMYMVAGTAGKCIQGFPGVSFVLVRKGFMENVVRKYPKRSWYLNLGNYYEDTGKKLYPLYPGNSSCMPRLNEALSELLEEGVAQSNQPIRADGRSDPGTHGSPRGASRASPRAAARIR